MLRYLERQQSGVDGVLELQFVVVALLEESLRVDHVLADRRRFPREVRARRVHLNHRVRVRVRAARDPMAVDHMAVTCQYHVSTGTALGSPGRAAVR